MGVVRKASAVGIAVATASGAAAASSTAAERTEGDHCVLEIVGQDEGGRFITAQPFCYETLEEALRRVGLDGKLPSVAASGAVQERVESASSLPLAVHFDGANSTGASIIISGGECNGGSVNLSAAWVNRISSTWNRCPNTIFYDGFDKTGANEVTGLNAENLGPLNNRANSVGYA